MIKLDFFSTISGTGPDGQQRMLTNFNLNYENLELYYYAFQQIILSAYPNAIPLESNRKNDLVRNVIFRIPAHSHYEKILAILSKNHHSITYKNIKYSIHFSLLPSNDSFCMEFKAYQQEAAR